MSFGGPTAEGSRHRPLELRGAPLNAVDVAEIAAGRPVALDPAALAAVAANREAFDAHVLAGARIYGVTTGFGALVDAELDATELRTTQARLLRSHAAGVGPALPRHAVRAALAVRLNGLLRACSAVRPVVLERVLALLDADLLPVVPRTGSLGASGDLAPSAHAFLPLIGEGVVEDRAGRRLSGSAALSLLGLEPLVLEPKEGLALVNGTHFMAGLGALAAVRAARLIDAADAVAGMTLEALGGATGAFDARVHALRPVPGQARSAALVRAMVAGSSRVRASGAGRLQDAYSLRCVPQVHGAAREGARFHQRLVEADLAAVTDNPLVLAAVDGCEIVSAGNFHGQPLALAADTLRLALADVGSLSERRTFRLVSPSLNGGLPAFLTAGAGSTSGYMIAQYTAAALVQELRVLAHPVSVDSIPTSDNQEDHVSMGMTGAVMALDALDRLGQVLAIELLCAVQATELRAGALGPAGAALAGEVRARVPHLDDDRPPAVDVQAVLDLLESDALQRIVASAQAGPQPVTAEATP
jgi:histidine ammonia-lyase